MTSSEAPIGLFDSGVGGLSIWREIHRLLPNEASIYLADSANAPYGDKPVHSIQAFSRKNTELLLERGAKIIVVACNTATTNAIAMLRAEYNVPFIGIEPATKPAAIATKTGKIGILATKGTLASELFVTTSAVFRGDVKIIEAVGNGLVPIIESGELEEAKDLLVKYLSPMVEAGVDSIVLGCSHYPFLIELIQSIIPEDIQIIDSGAPVARRTKSILESKGLLSTANESPSLEFYTNGNLPILHQFLKRMKVEGYEANNLDF